MIASIAVPALVALLLKLGLLGYAIRSNTRNATTRLFFALLVALALHNLSEVLALTYFSNYGITPIMQQLGFAYVALLIPVIALILHVSLHLSLDLPANDPRARLQWLLYIPTTALLFLLLFTDQLVLGFQPFKNTVLRMPGPWYFLFETYLQVYLLAAVAYLFYGARRSRESVIRRVRNRWWLVAILPTVLLFVYLIIANHFGLAKLTSTIYIPITLTFFLIVTAYATHQYRLFDIEFFIPWSKLRKRKTVFYQRMQQMVAELADLNTVDEALEKVSGILRCPVAIVGGWRPVLAYAGGGSLEIAQFPHDRLGNLDRVVVVNEVEQAMPQLHATMKQFRVAAIVPFYPHSKTASSWMLLGDSFSDSVYTPLDFKNVDALFEALKEFFLDKIAFLRTELAQAQAQTRTLEEKFTETKKGTERLREELGLLRDANFRLMRENNTIRKTLEANPAPGKHDDIAPRAPQPAIDWGKTFSEQIERYEVDLIEQALKQCNGSQADAARLLGMRPNTLHYKIGRYGLAKNKKDGDNRDNDEG